MPFSPLSLPPPLILARYADAYSHADDVDDAAPPCRCRSSLIDATAAAASPPFFDAAARYMLIFGAAIRHYAICLPATLCARASERVVVLSCRHDCHFSLRLRPRLSDDDFLPLLPPPLIADAAPRLSFRRYAATLIFASAIIIFAALIIFDFLSTPYFLRHFMPPCCYARYFSPFSSRRRFAGRYQICRLMLFHDIRHTYHYAATPPMPPHATPLLPLALMPC